MGPLGNRLALIADTQESPARDRQLAALRIGATLALARVRELDGYDWEAKLKTACGELVDAPEQKPNAPTEYQAAADQGVAGL